MNTILFSNNSINDLNEKCRELHAALLIAEFYYPKQIRDGMDNELKFWTAVTNMYGLFYDCMPYFFRQHYQFMHQKYDNKTKTILSLMEQEQVLTSVEYKKVMGYFRALTEIRSIYCHNKPPGTIITPKLNKVFGDFNLVPYHHDQISSSQFDFDTAYKLFESTTEHIMNILEKGIMNLIVIGRGNVILEWQKALIGWFLQSYDIRIRSIDHLRTIHGEAQYPWNISDTIEQDFKKSSLTFLDLSDKLLNIVDCSAIQMNSHEIWRLAIDEILS